MITSIGLQNFKSWGPNPEKVKLAPLTAFFGANSAGKSSLIQFLLMLKQTVESSDRKLVLNFGDDRSLVELGSFKDIAYRHNIEAQIGCEIEWQLPHPLEIPIEETSEISSSPIKLQFSANFTQNDTGQVKLENFEYKFNQYSGGIRRDSNDNKSDNYVLTVQPDDLGLRSKRGRPPTISSPYSGRENPTGRYIALFLRYS